MAVYEHGYRRYQGAVTAAWQRLLILPHYAYKDAFQSKFLVMFFALGFVPPLVGSVLIYLHDNLDAMKILEIDLDKLFTIGPAFFGTFLEIQTQFFAFFLTMFIGPGLISRDLANNGLALYFSRPLSRTEYVIGKLLVLVILLSLVTWVPCLGLFFMQANLEGWSWMVSNLRIAVGIFIGSWVWILLISLLGLALSALVRWRAVAGLGMLMVFMVGGLFGLMFKEFFKTDWGYIFNLGQLTKIVFAQLLGTELPEGPPPFAAWVAIVSFMAFCVFVLDRKLRAYEVVT
ncbi:MAG: hypothetical protein HC897_05800 [Thermoanaerobaculia bacterium]|nr:hypothetical protein [Thermoanaerobaculia bacterium]